MEGGDEESRGTAEKRKRNMGEGGCVITSVCSEVKEINWQLMEEYGLVNDKSVAENVSIVL